MCIRDRLCTYKKADYPLYLEMLSLHVYTMEELCYAMESNLFLLDESWMGTEFFQWIAEGLGDEMCIRDRAWSDQ